jgi:hypothetical protein
MEIEKKEIDGILGEIGIQHSPGSNPPSFQVLGIPETAK